MGGDFSETGTSTHFALIAVNVGAALQTIIYSLQINRNYEIQKFEDTFTVSKEIEGYLAPADEKSALPKKKMQTWRAGITYVSY